LHLAHWPARADKILSEALALAEEDVDINARLAKHGAEVVPAVRAPGCALLVATVARMRACACLCACRAPTSSTTATRARWPRWTSALRWG
jgi:hypothetical protein